MEIAEVEQHHRITSSQKPWTSGAEWQEMATFSRKTNKGGQRSHKLEKNMHKDYLGRFQFNSIVN